jgi:hypothetical protein
MSQGDVRGADVLIYDSTYSDEQFVPGRGHSTWQEGMRIAEAAGVATFVAFHHDPDHNDRDHHADDANNNDHDLYRTADPAPDDRDDQPADAATHHGRPAPDDRGDHHRRDSPDGQAGTGRIAGSRPVSCRRVWG